MITAMKDKDNDVVGQLRKSRKMIKINELVTVITIILFSILGTIICFALNREYIYNAIVFLPIAYCILSCSLLLPAWIKSGSYTVIIFTACCGLRYVLLPVIISIYPTYGLANYTNTDAESINAAIILMLYELLVCSLFLAILSYKFKANEKKRNNIVLAKGNFIIIAFVLIAALTLMLIPDPGKNISFFIISAANSKRVSSNELMTFTNILTQIFQIGRLALYILMLLVCKKRYETNHKKIYILLAIVATIINLGIIIGEARSVQIQFAFAAAYLLSQCFPEEKKKLTRIVAISAAIIVSLLSIYKHLYVFKYGSYFATLSQGGGYLEIVKSAETYLFGPQAVASVMELKKQGIEFDLKRLFFDFARSFMGINFIVKKSDILTTSQIYNLFISNGYRTSGNLVPITAQGYLYFGWILSPILICSLLILSLYLEKIFRTSNSAYVMFFGAYVFARSSTCIVASNINTVITNGSMMLLSAGTIYLLQKLLPIKITLKEKRPKMKNELNYYNFKI